MSINTENIVNTLPKPEFANSVEERALEKILENRKNPENASFSSKSTISSYGSPVKKQKTEVYNSPLKEKPNEANFHTPSPKKFIPLPQTPRNGKRKLFTNQNESCEKESIKNLFSNPLNLVRDPTFDNIKNPSNFSLNEAYQINDRIHTVIKQISNKDCGAAAFLMIFTDLIRDIPKKNMYLTEDLWRWASRCYLINAASLLKQCNPFLKDIPYQLNRKIYKITGGDDHAIQVSSPKEIILQIKEIIEKSKFSVILSITHPKIYGHWIVVDSIDEQNDKIFTRDPYSGLAYKLTFEELEQSIDKKVSTDCIFIGQRDQV